MQAVAETPQGRDDPLRVRLGEREATGRFKKERIGR
jgi:hypothetical protein